MKKHLIAAARVANVIQRRVRFGGLTEQERAASTWIKEQKEKE